MPNDQSTEEIPTGYWAGVGFQRHVLPTTPLPRTDGKLTASCGVLARPSEVDEPGFRPRCAWCSNQVQTAKVQTVPAPKG